MFRTRLALLHSLKVVVSKCAFKSSLTQTALLETYVRSGTDTGHSYQAFQLTLFHHERLLGRAGLWSLRDSPGGACWKVQKQ